MLFIHETHEVIGRKEDEFEAAIRDEWLPTLAKGDGARLLWYCIHVHGTGPAYNVVTITAVHDGADWQTELDALRHRVTSSVMLPVPWSPMQEVDFAELPTTGVDHEPSIYM